VEEAICALEKQTPLGPLELCPAISCAALDLLLDHGPKGMTGHTGSDGSSPFDRMSRYGEWQVTAGENCAYGGKSGKEHIDQLIIDDGVASRGHRHNIFNEKFKMVGIAVGGHKAYGTACIQDFAGGFSPADNYPQPPDMPTDPNGPSKEQAAAAAAIQRKHRSNAAKENLKGMKEDKKLLEEGGGSVVEAEGALTPELEEAIKNLPDMFTVKIKEGLKNGHHCRVTTTEEDANTVIKVKLWGDGCTCNFTMTIGKGG